ncbi:MAG: O-antigen polymerase [Ramlibacter sp.]|nr:O-antigen polymerase [Ramlibacter sp.]
MMAAVVPISLAATSVSKLLVFLFGLVVLAVGLARHRRMPPLQQLRTPAVILLMLAALAASLTYTTAPGPQAMTDLGKYGKLLVIPLVLVLVRTRREAMIALALYGTTQFLVVLTSYLLSMGLILPWVVKDAAHRLSIGTVYSSYLDQSIMTAGLAALCWNLRHEFPGRLGRGLAIAVAAVCAVNVLFLLPGRSGQAALLAAMVLALFWALPRRAQPVALLGPLLLIAAAMAVSPSFRDRLTSVVSESRAYSQGDRSLTSSGIRLNFWQRSVEAIAEKPLAGTGVGSWNAEYRRLEGNQLSLHSATVRNPHQEYLMWGVQLGVGGIVLLIAFLLMLARDASTFKPDVRRATYSFVAILAVVCLFNSTLFDALIGDYFCVLIGLLLVLGLQAAPAPPKETPA